MTVAESLTDYMGHPIKVGCTIIYPVRRGSSMWLSQLRVQRIVDNDGGKAPYLAGFNNEGRRINIHNLKNVVVVTPLVPMPSVN